MKTGFEQIGGISVGLNNLLQSGATPGQIPVWNPNSNSWIPQHDNWNIRIINFFQLLNDVDTQQNIFTTNSTFALEADSCYEFQATLGIFAGTNSHSILLEMDTVNGVSVGTRVISSKIDALGTLNDSKTVFSDLDTETQVTDDDTNPGAVIDLKGFIRTADADVLTPKMRFSAVTGSGALTFLFFDSYIKIRKIGNENFTNRGWQ